jgi:hypothetical protein
VDLDAPKRSRKIEHRSDAIRVRLLCRNSARLPTTIRLISDHCFPGNCSLIKARERRELVELLLEHDQIDNLYQLLKSRQLEAAQAALADKPGDHAGIEFEQDIEHMFYGPASSAFAI